MLRIAIILVLFSLTMAKINESVIIIGAGASGYSAAVRLMSRNIDDIVILEAEDRIGGRINSIPFSDGYIDLGAQWVHGQDGNIVYKMVHKHFDLGTTPFNERSLTFVFSNGTKPDQELFTNISQINHDIYTGIEEAKNFSGSFGEMFLETLREVTTNDSFPVFKDLDPKIIEIMKEDAERNINGYCALKSWFDMSAELSAAEAKIYGNLYNTWKKQGYKTVFDFISRKLPKPSEYIDIESKVHLNKKVTNIKYNASDVNSKVLVTCADGTSYEATYVIFTASLGVLKKYHETLFTPALPENNILAIKTMGFGAAGKIFLEFDEPFWTKEENEFLAYELLWLDADKDEAKATNREWMLGISAFFMVDEFPNMLEVYIAGPKIDQFEASSDEKIINDCMWALEKFLGKSLIKPKAMTRSKWLSNDNFLGTYSYPSMDAEKAGVYHEHLAESIYNRKNEPILIFAGEATDGMYPGTVQGAVQSGIDAANQVCKYCRNAP
ncbi:spermine oxidase-like [Chironomus tepperi]|uniref:spermine oxidase-like n=1 Tax=Chironomus tepperi TaxID=113505 RepID=UPI00391F8095